MSKTDTRTSSSLSHPRRTPTDDCGQAARRHAVHAVHAPHAARRIPAGTGAVDHIPVPGKTREQELMVDPIGPANHEPVVFRPTPPVQTGTPERLAHVIDINLSHGMSFRPSASIRNRNPDITGIQSATRSRAQYLSDLSRCRPARTFNATPVMLDATATTATTSRTSLTASPPTDRACRARPIWWHPPARRSRCRSACRR